jgi:fibro-slime domain-containing protein/RHS repeat-associated protein
MRIPFRHFGLLLACLGASGIALALDIHLEVPSSSGESYGLSAASDSYRLQDIVIGAPLAGSAQGSGYWLSIGASQSIAPYVLSILRPGRDTVVQTPEFLARYTLQGAVYDTLLRLEEGQNSFTIDTILDGVRLTQTRLIRLDRRPPLVRILSPSGDTLVHQGFIHVAYEVDGTPASSVCDLLLGENACVAVGVDEAGNKAADSVTVRYAPLCPPVFSAIPKQVTQLGQPFRPIALGSYLGHCSRSLSDLSFSVLNGEHTTLSFASLTTSIRVLDSAWYGVDTVRVIAIDPDGMRDTGTIALERRNTVTLTGVARDFKETNSLSPANANPDFQPPSTSCGGKGLVKSHIAIAGPDADDRNPELSPGGNNCYMTHFPQWYTSSPDSLVNRPFAVNLVFSDAGNGLIRYINPSFFPIDRDSAFTSLGSSLNPFGHLQTSNPQHNFGFTFELHAQFQYRKGSGQVFKFTGDDDVWVFINDSLVIDLGGIHSAKSDSVFLDRLPSAFLSDGGVYPLDFFSAERHTTQSNIMITTSLALVNNPSLIAFDKERYDFQDTLVQVTLADRSQAIQAETRRVRLLTSSGDTLWRDLRETGATTGRFTAAIKLQFAVPAAGDTVLQAGGGASIRALYADPDRGDSATATAMVDGMDVVEIESPRDGALLNRSPVPVVWSLNGIRQTGQASQVLADGENLIIRSFSAHGTTASDSVRVTLDSVPPRVVISAPPEGFLTRSPGLTVAWSVDGVPQTTETSATLSEGDNLIIRSAADAAGNVGMDSVVVALDTRAPVVFIQSPADGSVTNQSAQTIRWTVDNVPFSADTLLAEGQNRIIRAALDPAGNVGADTSWVILDTRPPVVSIVSPADGSLTNQPLQTLLWSVDGASFQIDTLLGEGENLLLRSRIDAAGNVGADTVRVILDTHPPVVKILAPVQGDTLRQTLVHLAWTADGILFAQDSVFAAGPLVIRKGAVDAAGNAGWDSVAVFLRPNRCPVLDYLPAQVVMNRQIRTLAINASDADGDSLAFRADALPSFATLIQTARRSAALALAPGAADTGTFAIALSATDGLCSASVATTVSLIPEINSLSAGASVLNLARPWRMDSGFAIGSPLSIRNGWTPAQASAAYSDPVSLANQAVPVPDRMAYSDAATLFNAWAPYSLASGTAWGNPVSAVNMVLPAVPFSGVVGEPVSLLNLAAPFLASTSAFGSGPSVLNLRPPFSTAYAPPTSVLNAWYFPDLVVTAGAVGSLAYDPGAKVLRGPFSFAIANNGLANVRNPFKTSLFFDENRDGRFTPGSDTLLSIVPHAGILFVGQSETFSVDLSVPARFFYRQIGVAADAEDAISEWNKTNNTAFTARLSDPLAPVVKIVSPQDDFTTEDASIAVAWTVDGVPQTANLTAAMVPGDNRIIRSATDSAGNVGADTVYGRRGNCVTYANTSVSFNRTRSYGCLVLDHASYSIFGELRADSVLVDGGTLTLSDSLSARVVIAKNGGLITHQPGSASSGGTAATYRAAISAVRIDLADSARIDASGRGFPHGYYPDASFYSMMFPPSASHGGSGISATHAPYGDFRLPALAGAGGGTTGSGNAGGGVLSIAADSIRLDGRIAADATQDASNYGGAGGSILIRAGKITGTGPITARGTPGRYPGGGGRIAIYAPVLPDTVVGRLSTSGFELGTIYLDRGAGRRELRILDPIAQDQNAPGLDLDLNDSLLRLTVAKTGKVLLAKAALLKTATIGTGGSLSVTAGLRADSIRIDSAGSVTHPACVFPYAERLMLAANDVAIARGGAINTNAKGYPGGYYKDYAPALPYSAAGGTHAGVGHFSTMPPYGDSLRPIYPGSGGGDAGGGAIRIEAKTFRCDGSLTADGKAYGYYEGSGAGGSIWIRADSILGAGTLSVSAPPNSMPQFADRQGGGGRIMLHACFVADSIRIHSRAAGYQPGTVKTGCHEIFPPLVTIRTPYAGMITRQSPLRVEWQADLIPQTRDTLEWFSEGYAMVRRSFTNASGQTGSDSVRVLYDTTAPSVTFDSHADRQVLHSRAMRFRVRMNDALSGVQSILFNGLTRTLTADTISLDTLLRSGWNRIAVEVADKAGNRRSAAIDIRYNSVPRAEDDYFTLQPGDTLYSPANGLLANDNDPDPGDTLRTRILSGPFHGVLRFDPDQSFSYVPYAGYSGPDSLAYSAIDGELESNIAIARFNVAGAREGRTYTTGFDFREGRHLAIGGRGLDQLQLNDTMQALPFLWVGLGSQNLVAKVDAKNGKILGEYRLLPYYSSGGISSYPSGTTPTGEMRVAVDREGNVWVTRNWLNRAIKIGAAENNQCVDRNGDGKIATSTGQGDILAWRGGTAADTSDIARFADDECILAAVKLEADNLSQVSVDPKGDVWVGSLDAKGYDLIDGGTYRVKRSEHTVGFGASAGIIAPNGIMTASSPLLRWDVSKPLMGPSGASWTGFPGETGKGMPCLDKIGNVWVPRGWNPWGTGNLNKYGPDGALLGTYLAGSLASYSVGCAVGDDGNVWVSQSSSGYPGKSVFRIKADGSAVGEAMFDSPNANPTGLGLSVDAAGKVWVGQLGKRLQRIDPNAGPVGADGRTRLGQTDLIVSGLSGEPYTYGDMTGHDLYGKAQSGAWEIVFDAKEIHTDWGRIAWNARACDGGGIEVSVASGNDSVSFRDFIPVSNGQTFDSPAGRFLKARVRFTRSVSGESPLLYDLTLGAKTFTLPPMADVPPTVQIGTDTLRLSQGEAALDPHVCDEGVPGTGRLTYRWNQLSGPGQIRFSSDTVRAPTAAFPAQGAYRIALSADDSRMRGADTVVVLVSPNNAPVITSQPPLHATVGLPYVYSVTAYDPDGQKIRYRLDRAPMGMTMDSAGRIAWTPGPASVGRDTVGVVAFDSSGGSGTQIFGIRIDPVRAAALDLKPLSVDAAGLVIDRQGMKLQGTVTVKISAQGGDSLVPPYAAILFQDNDFDGRFDAHADGLLDRRTVASQYGSGDTATIAFAVNQSLNSGAALIYVFVDADSAVPESDEGNNVLNQKATCSYRPPVRSFNPALEWKFDSSLTAPDRMHPYSAPAVARLHDDNGDGRIDSKDIPDIVFVAASTSEMNNRVRNGILRAIKGDGSGELFANLDHELHTSGGVAIGDIDHDGLPEIIAIGEDDLNDHARIVAFENTGAFKWESQPLYYWSGNGEWSISLSDLEGDGSVEIVVGGNILNADGTLRRHLDGSEQFLPMASVVDLDLDGKQEIIVGNTAYSADGSIFWRNYSLEACIGCHYITRSSAIAELDGDPYPEIVTTLGGGWAAEFGYVILEHDGKVKKIQTGLTNGVGGPPLVADFDGDGKPEIGIANASSFTVWKIDTGTSLVVPPRTNLRWQVPTQDGSSGWTGATAFDFDNDGATEVVFADEVRLWIADGRNGNILFSDSVGSGTSAEYPVVADIDNDGNAEIVVIANQFTASGISSKAHKGIRVYGDKNDTWVGARAIWNEHNYHVTNVEDDGTIPIHEPPSWQNGCGYFRNRADAPSACDDIAVAFLRVDGTACTDSVRLTARLANAGSHVAGKGLPVSFYLNALPGNGGSYIGTGLTTRTLAIGGFEDVTVRMLHPISGQQTIFAVADQDSGGRGAVSESDDANNVVSARFDLCDRPPLIASSPVLSGQEGAAYLYAVQASDPDGDTLRFQLPVRPEGMAIDSANGTISWTPGQGRNGTHQVEIRVSDGRGGSASQRFALTIGDNLNDFPRILSAPNRAGEEGYHYEYRVLASDLNGDPLSYTLVSGPPGMLIDSAAGILSWNPAVGQAGAHPIAIKAGDGRGGFADQSFVLEIKKGANRHPLIQSEPPMSARIAQPYAYQVQAQDPDQDVLRYFLVEYPAGMTIDESTGLVKWTPAESQAGERAVKLAVWDYRGMSAAQSFAIQVGGANHAPTLASIPDTSVHAGTRLTVRFQYQDAESDTVSLSVSAPAFAVLRDSGRGWAELTLPTSLADTGRYPITIRATDGSATAEEHFTFWVLPLGQPPRFTSVPVWSGTVGTAYAYLAQATDPEGEAVRYALNQSPAGMVIDTSSGRIDWVPAPGQSGDNAITVCAFDPWIGSCQQFVVRVADSLNHGPIIGSVPDTTVSNGQHYQYAIQASDPDGDPVAYALVRAPTGMTLSTEGRVDWPESGIRPATAEVEISVTDGHGGQTRQAWSVHRVPDDLPPLVRIRFSANPIVPHGWVTVSVDASDNVGVVSKTLTRDGAPVALTGDQYQYQAGSAGNVAFQATARDAFGNQGRDDALLHVSTRQDTIPPALALTYSPANPLVGDLITFNVSATDAGGIDPERVWLLVDGRYLPLSGGHAEMRAIKGGALTALATAYDYQGNYGEARVPFQVYVSGSDHVFPLARISSPAADSEILGPVEIRGTATDAHLAYYTLSYRRDDSPDFVEFYRGTVNVDSGFLGSFDPTVLENGVYTVRLRTFDAYDNTAWDDIRVTVAGNRKVGEFTLGFSDLRQTQSGLDLEITRTYDSRIKTKGDFGIGWRMGIRTTRLYEANPAGEAWQVYDAGGRTFCASEYLCVYIPEYRTRKGKKHDITIEVPGGRPQEFDIQVKFNGPFENNFGTISAVPAPGTYSNLEILGDVNFFRSGEDLYAMDMSGLLNPNKYKLTLLDGSSFIFDQDQGGLIGHRDRNGNEISLTSSAIRHSDRESLIFARDAQQRITSISAPGGRATHYEYDGHGNLRTFTDPEGNVTIFKYAPHGYLTEIIDPRGIRGLRTEYDDEGRVVRRINAQGDTLKMTHDLGASTEEIEDFDGNRTRFAYDRRGNVTYKEDPAGNAWHYAYDSLGNLVETVLPGGARKRSTFDDKGNVLSSVDELGHLTFHTYDAKGRPLTMTDPLGRVTRFEYDGNGNLVKETGPDNVVKSERAFDSRGHVLTEKDAMGNITRYAYDIHGRRIETRDPLGHATRFGYDAAGNVILEVNGRGDSAHFGFDLNGNPVFTVNAMGDTIRTRYNSIGKVVGIVDAMGHVTRYGYNNLGEKVADTAADGSVTSRSYDGQGNISSVVDPLGRIAAFAYDHNKRMKRATFADGGFMENEYDALGRRIRSVDARGNATGYGHDAAGRNTMIADPLGNVTRFEYDAVGRKKAMTDPLNRRTEYEYDPYDRLVLTRFADGSTKTIGYDLAGRKTSESDQAGKTTRFEYDPAGRLVAVVDALEHRTEYAYDESNNRIIHKDAKNRSTLMAYDALNRMVSRTYPNGNRERWRYDANGNIISYVKGADSTVYRFDEKDREISRKYLPSGHEVRTTYLADGKRDSVIDYRGVTSFSYDVRGRLAAERMPNGGFIRSEYDSEGNRVRVITPFDTTRYSFDALNRMDSVISKGRATVYRYNAVGNRDSVANPNGTAVGYSYDNLNRLTLVRNWRGDALLSRFTYAKNAAGIRSAVDELDGSHVAYGYDDLYRLTSEVRTGTEPYSISYTYDDVGNRLTQAKNGVTTAYAYNSRDQVESESGPAGEVTYNYDAAGRQTSKSTAAGTISMDWIDGDRLASVNGPGVSVQYQYDTDGRRVKETAGGEVKQYLIDRLLPYGQVILETDATGNPNARYVYGTDRVSQERGGITHWYVSDGQGSVRQLADSGGFVSDNYVYTAFGESQASTGNTINDFKYVGEQFDPNSGFYYLRARWMNPTAGRFVSIDPYEGEPQAPITLHRYLYAGSSPISFSDPGGNLFGIIDVVVAEVTMQSIYMGYMGMLMGISKKVLDVSKHLIQPGRALQDRALQHIGSDQTGVWYRAYALGVDMEVAGYQGVAKAIGDGFANHYLDFLAGDIVKLKTGFGILKIDILKEIYAWTKAGFEGGSVGEAWKGGGAGLSIEPLKALGSLKDISDYAPAFLEILNGSDEEQKAAAEKAFLKMMGNALK